MTLGLIKNLGGLKNCQKLSKIGQNPENPESPKNGKKSPKTALFACCGKSSINFLHFKLGNTEPPRNPWILPIPPHRPIFWPFFSIFWHFLGPPPWSPRIRGTIKNSKFYQKNRKKSKKIAKNSKKTPKNLGTGCIVDTFLAFFSKNTLFFS